VGINLTSRFEFQIALCGGIILRVAETSTRHAPFGSGPIPDDCT